MLRRLVYTVVLAVSCLSASSQSLTLFSSETKEAVPKCQAVVMNFLERYFTELPHQKHTTIETKMADDKVFFRKGHLSDLRQIVDTMPFSINLHDRYYEVMWQRQDEPFVTIAFPAQYDLLLGMQKNEAQDNLKNVILSAPKHIGKKTFPTDLQLQDDSIWQSKTEHFELESLNDALYYNKVCEEYKPVWDTAHLDYSAANLFHGLIADADYRMYVEQAVYGMKTVSYLIPFSQWCNYCAEWGLKLYFGVEEQLEDGLLAVVIAHSRELGFNHLLSVYVPDKFVTSKGTVLKVRMTPYIPTHNVKNLFKKESENRRKIIWQ